MNRLLLDEKKYKRFVKKYKDIFKNLNIPKNHFDGGKKIVGFCLVIVDSIFLNQRSKIKDKSHLLQKLFNNFYQNIAFCNIYKSFEKDINIKIKDTDCLKKFINDLLIVFPKIKNNQEVFNILFTGLKYVIFNCLPYMINSNIEANIMNFKNYEKQKNILMKNVKLFAQLKMYITHYFKNESNKVISLILGLSQRFYKF